jgi:hypothetical protein
MEDNLLDLEELALKLGMNPTHLGKRVREDKDIPRYNLNPKGKRARYRFDYREVKAYFAAAGKAEPEPDAETLKSTPGKIEELLR